MTHVLIGVPAREEDKALWEAVPGCEFRYDEAFDAQSLAWADVIFGIVPAKKLALCRRLKWIQFPAAGVDYYCMRRGAALPAGVTLTNATGAFGRRIAEHALAAVLGLYNNFPQYRDMQRTGGFENLGMPLNLHGDTVLVIGAGDIGTAFARLTRPFGCRNIAVRRTRAPLGEPFDETYTLRELPALLPQADAVLCALPATRETQHVMGAEQFALMKRASVFVNVGRGSAVDTDALAAALESLYPGRKLIFLSGVLADKDWHSMFRRVLPLAKAFVAVTPDSPRALPAAELAAWLAQFSIPVSVQETLDQGVDTALALAGPEDVICAWGSLYSVGEIRHHLGLC